MRLLALVLLASLLTGCGPGGEPDGKTPVSVQLNWVAEPQFGGIFAAEHTGAFGRAGLDVQIRAGGPNVPAVQMAASGQVTFALAAADELLTIRQRGADVVAVFATFQHSPRAVMVRASAGIDSLEALLDSGLTLAVEPGLAFVKFLDKRFGLDGVDVVPFTGGITHYLSDPAHAQQCFVSSEPIAAAQRGEPASVFLVADLGFDPYTSVVITRQEMIDRDPDTVRRFVQALRAGWEAYLQDPAPTNRAMHAINTAMPLPAFAAAAKAQAPLIRTGQTDRLGLGCMTPDRWRTLQEQLHELGELETIEPVSGLFVTMP